MFPYLSNAGGSTERLLSWIDPTVSRILDKALNDVEVTPEEGLVLFRTEGRELQALLLSADELRRTKVGERVTFVVVRNINFTNICDTGCRFCAFAVRRDDPDAEFLSLEEIAARAEEAWNRGATEVCIQGGLHPDIDASHYRNILVAIKERVPEMHIHAFSPFEIKYGPSGAACVWRTFSACSKNMASTPSRHGGGNPRYPDTSPADPRQTFRRGVGAHRQDRAPAGHPLHLYHHVRAHRRSGTMGGSLGAAAGDSEGDGRPDRARAPGFCSLGCAHLSGRRSSPGPHGS